LRRGQNDDCNIGFYIWSNANFRIDGRMSIAMIQFGMLCIYIWEFWIKEIDFESLLKKEENKKPKAVWLNKKVDILTHLKEGDSL
jgi:hypothetical protein